MNHRSFLFISLLALLIAVLGTNASALSAPAAASTLTGYYNLWGYEGIGTLDTSFQVDPGLQVNEVYAAAPVGSSSPAQQAWDIQRVDDPRFLDEKMGDHAAVYDSEGVLHAAFGGDHLYYARCENGICAVETVDPSDYVGMYASLALDSQGNPHIAYYDLGQTEIPGFCDEDKVKYAAWDGSQWTIQVVDEGCTGEEPSIALDNQDIPHISYFDDFSDDLKLADQEGNLWNTYTPDWLPSFSWSGRDSSLLTDTAGNLHLAFIAGGGGGSQIWYTKKIADSWEPLVAIDPQAGAQRFAMTLDSTGKPHLGYNVHYYDAGSTSDVYKLRYTRFDGSSWQAPVEIADMEYLGWTSIVVGTDGYPRIAYKANGAAAVVTKTATGWQASEAVPNTDGTERMYLGQAGINVFGLVYYTGGALKTVHKNSPPDIWSAPVTIATTGGVGNTIAMATSPTGDLHVVYSDYWRKQLRYAHRSVGQDWQIETLITLTEDFEIRAADIDLDTNGRPHIVYQEYYSIDQRSALKVIYWSGTTWVSMGSVHQPGHNGCAPSLDLDTVSQIYIAYNDCDYIHDNLTLATYDGSWHYQTVDLDADTSNASLQVDVNGTIYISYTLYDYPNNILRLATKEVGVTWNVEDITTGEFYKTSLALDAAGAPMIAFTEDAFPDYTAKFAYWDGFQWQFDSVATISRNEIKLAVDPIDRPHLALICGQYHLCYAVKDGTNWTITDPVDWPPPAYFDINFGTTNSIAIGFGSLGLPVIVYDGENDLKAAEMFEYRLVFLPLVLR
jgi:hypothetical protein